MYGVAQEQKITLPPTIHVLRWLALFRQLRFSVSKMAEVLQNQPQYIQQSQWLKIALEVLLIAPKICLFAHDFCPPTFSHSALPHSIPLPPTPASALAHPPHPTNFLNRNTKISYTPQHHSSTAHSASSPIGILLII